MKKASPQADTLFADSDIPSKPPAPKTATRPKPEVIAQTAQSKGAVAVRQPQAKPPARKTEPEPVNMLAILADLTRDRNVDPAKMREFLEVQKEIRAEESRMAFTRAKVTMSEFLPVIKENGEIDVPAKTGKTGYKRAHAKMIDINEAIKPLLREYGFDLWFEPGVLPDGRVSVIGHLDHVDGHGKTGLVPMSIDTSGGKNNQQGVGSSMTYAQRYVTRLLLNIDSKAPQDQDDDAKSAGKLEKKQQAEKESGGEVVALTKKQLEELHKEIDKAGASAAILCRRFEVERLEDIPPGLFGDAVTACKNFANLSAENKEKLKRQVAAAASAGDQQ